MTQVRKETANRLVVVDETGRVYDRYGLTIESVQQDEGQTLKIFVSPLPRDEKIKAEQAYIDAWKGFFGSLPKVLDDLLRRYRDQPTS